MKFIPIINLNLGAGNLSYEDTRDLYKSIVEVFEASEIKQVEFSFASSSIFDHLDLIVESELYKQGRVCFGSLVDSSVIMREPQSNDVDIFAPAFDDEVFEVLHKTERSLRSDYVLPQDDNIKSVILSRAQRGVRILNYYPGIYDLEDFEELKSKFKTMSKIKIFPVEVNSTQSLLKSLQAPYPELKQERFLKRIIAPNQELAESYDLYTKYQTNPLIRLVTKPRDYQKIRKEFIANSTLKILLATKPRDLQELINKIKECDSSVSLIATGFNRNTLDLDHLETLGIDYIATRVFRNIIMDLLAGNVSMMQARELMKREIDPYVVSLRSASTDSSG